MFDYFDNVLVVTKSWADEIAGYALVLVAVGALAMALIEAVKALLKLRANYHERKLKDWLRRDLKAYLDERDWSTIIEELSFFKKSDALDISHNSIATNGTSRVISLATGIPTKLIQAEPGFFPGLRMSPERALYSLSIEKMMGQVQDAVDVILENPEQNLESFLLLTVNSSKDDIKAWLEHAAAPYKTTAEMDEDEREAIARVGSRLQQSVQRQLDTFQLKTTYSWALLNQMSAIVLGAYILFLAIVSSGAGPESVFATILVSLAGGIVAPVAKDLVSNLKKVNASE